MQLQGLHLHLSSGRAAVLTALWPLNIGASIAVASDNATEHPGFVENATADGNI